MKFDCNRTSKWLNHQRLCYFKVLLNIEISGEQDSELCAESLMNTGPDQDAPSENQSDTIVSYYLFTKRNLFRHVQNENIADDNMNLSEN